MYLPSRWITKLVDILIQDYKSHDVSAEGDESRRPSARERTAHSTSLGRKTNSRSSCASKT